MTQGPAALLPSLCLLALGLACQRPEGPAAGGRAESSVTVKGSDTMVLLGQRWAEAFMERHAEARVQVTGGGSGTGIAALLNGTTEIAMSSRPMKEAEKRQLQQRAGVAPRETAVARDGIVFYVHEANPLGALGKEQLRGIYLGDLTRWSQVGGPDAPIVVYSRENSSGTYAFVKEALLGGGDFLAAALTMPGTAAVVNAVSQERWGIGYGGAAYARGVKELKMRVGDEEVAPSAQNIRSGKYPLSRDLYFYTRGEPGPAAQRYIDFALSEAGQAIVTKVGYFPLAGPAASGAGEAPDAGP